jgi:hypothetical protein
MAWLTSDLLADVRRSGMLPDSTPSGVADDDILAHATKEMYSRLVPLVLSVREEFYVQQDLVALVANQQFYRVNQRAIGNKLRDVYLVLPDSSQQRLARLTPEGATEFLANPSGAVYPWAYYMENDSVMVLPTPTSSGQASLMLKYLMRPARLVTHNDNSTPHVVAVTRDITPGVTRITHTGSGAFNPSQSLDIVHARPGFRTMMIAQTPSASGTSGGFRYIEVSTSSLPSDFSTANNGGGAVVGDMISPAETSGVIQLPPELHNLLYQRTLCRVLQSIGDLESLQAAEANAQQMERDAVGMIANRVESTAKKVVGRLLQQPRRRYGYWF